MSDKSVVAPTCLERFSLSLVYDQSLPLWGWDYQEKMILNCRVKLAVKKWYISFARADWLIAVCHLNLGDTLFLWRCLLHNMVSAFSRECWQPIEAWSPQASIDFEDLAKTSVLPCYRSHCNSSLCRRPLVVIITCWAIFFFFLLPTPTLPHFNLRLRLRSVCFPFLFSICSLLARLRSFHLNALMSLPPPFPLSTYSSPFLYCYSCFLQNGIFSSECVSGDRYRLGHHLFIPDLSEMFFSLFHLCPAGCTTIFLSEFLDVSPPPPPVLPFVLCCPDWDLFIWVVIITGQGIILSSQTCLICLFSCSICVLRTRQGCFLLNVSVSCFITSGRVQPRSYFYSWDYFLHFLWYVLEGSGYCFSSVVNTKVSSVVCTHWSWPCLLLTAVLAFGFFLLCEDFGRMCHHPFPACAFFKVEISSRSLIPIFTSGWVHSGLASWNDCDRVFPEEWRVSWFPDGFQQCA